MFELNEIVKKIVKLISNIKKKMNNCLIHLTRK